MPSMPRPRGKAKKIAFNILGIPQNIKYRPNKKQRKIDQVLVFQETQRVR